MVFAMEYEMLCATPRISKGNSSAVMVHGSGSKPIIEVVTYNIRQRTGIQVKDVVPI